MTMPTPARTEINWTPNDEDKALIDQILDRAETAGHLKKRNRLNSEMDITACHLNGTPLCLAEWLHADDFNFLHDLYGIDSHMNRNTGRLVGCFVPRFAA
jgi:hypothetical protein